MMYSKGTHSSLDGERYEIRLAALLFLRCKKSQTISTFQLATNAKAGMKLDDIVLRYKTIGEPEVWQTWFLQLKKKTGRKLTDTALTGDGVDFGLKSYVESFVHIKKGFLADDKEEILNGTWENCHFGLFTNVKAEGILLSRTECGPLGELETLLQSEVKSPIVLGFEEERDTLIFNALKHDVNGKEFLKMMKVFPGQPTPDELVLVSKEDLKLHGDVPEENIDFLYDSYEKRVEKWWAKPKESDLLDENSDIYDLAVDETRSHHVGALSIRESVLACHDVQFTDLQPLEDNFEDCIALLHVIASESSLKLSCTKLLNFMRRKCLGSVTFFRLEILQQELDTVLPVWRSDGNLNWLVLLSNSEEGDEDHRELGDKISEILLENEKKRIAVVSRKWDSFTCYLKRKLVNDYKEIEDDSRVLQLDEEALGKLMKMSVSFQGCMVDIKSFFEGNDTSIQDITLDDSVLNSLNRLSTKIPTIGITIPDNSSGWYISRTLQCFTVLHDDVLRANLKGTVAVSGVTIRELQALIPAGESASLLSNIQGGCRFVILDPARAKGEWIELCETVNNAHWIHRQDGQLVLKESKGSVDELRRHVDPSSCLSYEVDNCFDVPQRAVLLVGEPGMGKTTLATHLAKQTKLARPTYWVVYVNLAKHALLLERGDGDHPVEFLAAVLDIEQSPFQMSLLQQAVEINGNVTVLLDGFDEICPVNESPGHRLIAGLLRTRVQKMWVTSRRSVGDAVEREMSTLVTSLKDFTMENQASFLLRFWKNKAGCKDKSDNELNDLIARLLTRLSHSLNDQERYFTGIPLQTMMLAEVFSEYAANPSESQFPKKFDLIYLFEEFVEKKFMTYVRKLWPDSYKRLNSTVLVEMRTSFNEKHMYASLVYLLLPDCLEKLDSQEEIVSKTNEFMIRVLSGEDKTGIVDGIINKRPKFIHRCFAEFFVAKYFFKSYKRNRDFLREYMFNGMLKVVCEMFNGMLVGRRPLHLAVLCNNMDLAGQLLAEGSDVDATDEGGRSALHLAAGHNQEVKKAAFVDVARGMPHREPSHKRRRHMVELLLENGADFNMEDVVLQWTPLQYAMGAGAWDVAEILLTTGSDPVSFTFPADTYTLWSSIIDAGQVNLMKCILDRDLFRGDHSDNCYVVQRSIINGHIALVKLLVKTSEDVLTPGIEGRTLIHQAARCGQRDILYYLIDVVKRDLGEIGCEKAISLLDSTGDTAASLAIENGFLAIARLLLECGGESNVVADNRSRLVLTASYSGRLDVIEFITSSLSNDPALLKSCLESSYDVGMKRVVMVALCGHSHILRYLVEKGCDISAAVDETGANVLHAAIGNGSFSDVRLVVECLGDDRVAVKEFVNAPYHGGVTPLHCITCVGINSSAHNHKYKDMDKIAEYLLSKGANIWAVDESGCTPFHWAAGRFACLPVMKVLIRSLGDNSKAIVSYVNARDSRGRTAKDIMQDFRNNVFFCNQKEHIKLFNVALNWLDRVLEANTTVGQ